MIKKWKKNFSMIKEYYNHIYQRKNFPYQEKE